jgi:hypothetical protein
MATKQRRQGRYNIPTYIVVSSPPAAEEAGAIGREIESRREF